MELEFTVLWHGRPVDFFRIDTGYAHKCPRGCCRAYHHIAVPPHRITSELGQPVTIVGSLWCPCVKAGERCTWHVHITHGVAYDA